jgi:hypothetical protein
MFELLVVNDPATYPRLRIIATEVPTAEAVTRIGAQQNAIRP